MATMIFQPPLSVETPTKLETYSCFTCYGVGRVYLDDDDTSSTLGPETCQVCGGTGRVSCQQSIHRYEMCASNARLVLMEMGADTSQLDSSNRVVLPRDKLPTYLDNLCKSGYRKSMSWHAESIIDLLVFCIRNNCDAELTEDQMTR